MRSWGFLRMRDTKCEPDSGNSRHITTQFGSVGRASGKCKNWQQAWLMPRSGLRCRISLSIGFGRRSSKEMRERYPFPAGRSADKRSVMNQSTRKGHTTTIKSCNGGIPCTYTALVHAKVLLTILTGVHLVGVETIHPEQACRNGSGLGRKVLPMTPRPQLAV